MAKLLVNGEIVEIDDARILSMAGRIRAARRTVRRGAPLGRYVCPWCSEECVGRAGLHKHILQCCKVPQEPAGPGDLQPWLPDMA